jgi:hypothetical protein
MTQIKNISMSPRLVRQVDRRRLFPRARLLAVVFDLFTRACDRAVPFLTPARWRTCTEAWDVLMYPPRESNSPMAPDLDSVTPAALADLVRARDPEVADIVARWTDLQAIAGFDVACLKNRSVLTQTIPEKVAAGTPLTAEETDFWNRHELESDGYEAHVRRRHGQRELPEVESTEARTDISDDDAEFAHAAGLMNEPALNIRGAHLIARRDGQWPITATSAPLVPTKWLSTRGPGRPRKTDAVENRKKLPNYRVLPSRDDE